jgi:hypothetical protein
MEMVEVRGLQIAMSAREAARRSRSCTAMWEMGQRRGGRSSTGSPTSSRSSHGTPPVPGAQPTRPSRSASTATPTASPGSSRTWRSAPRVWPDCRSAAIVALALQRRHSARSSTLILASAYAGWAGSLPPELAEQRLRQALALADGTPEAFVAALLPTMFSKPMPRETVDDFRSSRQAFHPRGFRAMAQASAEDVRDVLPHVDVPTLLVYGDRDVRAP